MKKIFVIVLSIVFILQCSVKTIIVASFFAQRDVIGKTLCENRNKPQLHCNGKCYLNKQLKKEQKHTSDLASMLKNMKKVTVYAQPVSKNDFGTFNSITTSYYNNYYIKAYPNELASVFHPPSPSCS